MWEESSEQVKPLRTGLTTGSCATACCVAAAKWLLNRWSHDLAHSDLSPTTLHLSSAVNSSATGQFSSDSNNQKISITLPAGKTVELSVSVSGLIDGAESADIFDVVCRAETIKDAGDDPDVTHGAKVFCELKLSNQPGVRFAAGEGVGTVTREGLALAVGEPAINPVPRKMMQDNLALVSQHFHYQGGFDITIGIENGAAIAAKTMNPRLGIVGGLSVLGTSGIVRPFSCAAWIASIHQAIDVASANQLTHIAATTGNSSEQAIREHYRLDDMALVEMGDFAGAVLKHLKRRPVARLSICGGFGKISKLAKGHMDLNSRVSSIDLDHIAEVAADIGANAELQAAIRTANTSIEALNLCRELPLGDAVCEQALQVARRIVPADVDVEVWAINRQGHFIGYAGRASTTQVPPSPDSVARCSR